MILDEAKAKATIACNAVAGHFGDQANALETNVIYAIVPKG
jgi:hypothetical protein